MEYLTTAEVARELGVTVRRVQAMVKAGRLPASRFGRSLMIRRADLSRVRDRRPGRPARPRRKNSD